MVYGHKHVHWTYTPKVCISFLSLVFSYVSVYVVWFVSVATLHHPAYAYIYISSVNVNANVL